MLRNRNARGLACAAAAALAVRLAAATAAAGQSAAEAAVLDALDYADDASAQRAWKPLDAGGPVAAVQADGRRATAFPCRFKGTEARRAAWDLALSADFSLAHGVQFRFSCPDRGAIGEFTLYLKSGGGWYELAFPQSTTGPGWHVVALRKTDARLTDRPAGWGAISGVRVAAWRAADADSVFYLADIARDAGDPDLALVRLESVLLARAPEWPTLVSYTRAVTDPLDAMGVSFAVVSDLDVSAERLRGTRVALLPYSPDYGPSAPKVLAAFLNRGGKLVSFHALPPELEQAAGLRSGELVPARFDGQFASVRPVNGGLPGFPAEVAQHALNIRRAVAEPPGRVAAQWFDAAGRNTGEPAVVLSRRGVHLTQVPIPDDATAQGMMLLAMAGQFSPGLWERAARAQVAGMGRFGPYADAAAAVAGLSRGAMVPAGAQALADGRRLGREADERLGGGDFPGAVEAAVGARRALIRAFAAAQEPRPGEFRGLWCHDPGGVDGRTWAEAVRLLADNGFTAVLPNVAWAGTASFRSRVLPVSPRVQKRGDPLQECLDACRARGVQCHAWIAVWNIGHGAPAEFAQRMKREGRIQVGADGKLEDRWLCPSNPQNRRHVVAAITDLVREYPVDGVHLDYMRYAGSHCCFCTGCRQRFEAVLGRQVEGWPGAVERPGATRDRWYEFRRGQIGGVMEEVSRQARAIRPGIAVSVAVFGNWSIDRDRVGQDWKEWCARGWADFVCPMNYTPDSASFESLTRRQAAWVGPAKCRPGIGLSTWAGSPDAVCRLIDQVERARRLDAGGFVVFEYDRAAARDIVPLCGLGLTRRAE